MKIRNRELKPYKPYVIAEMQNSWYGDYDMALEIATQLKLAGTQAIKFQYGRRPDQKKLNWGKIFKIGKELNINIGTSIDTIQDLNFVHPSYEDLIDFYKIGAAQNKDPRLIIQTLNTGKPTFISLGGLSSSEIKSLSILLHRKSSLDRPNDSIPSQCVLLHSIAKYPLDIQQSQMGVIRYLRREFQSQVGYSDHSKTSIILPVVAFTMGCVAIEKHVSPHITVSPNESVSILDDPGISIKGFKALNKCLAALERPLNTNSREVYKEELTNIAKVHKSKLLSGESK